MAGLPEALHLDNAPEFHAESLTRAAQEYGIRLEYRPPGRPHFGGHIERLIGTTMGAVHLLPGTTFSNVADKGNYPSEKAAVLTLPELESFIALQIAGVYHQSIHSALHRSPIQAWTERFPERSRPLRQPINPLEFFFDFLPAERRLIRRGWYPPFQHPLLGITISARWPAAPKPGADDDGGSFAQPFPQLVASEQMAAILSRTGP